MHFHSFFIVYLLLQISRFGSLQQHKQGCSSTINSDCNQVESESNNHLQHEKQKYLNPAWQPFLDSISRAEQEYDAVSSKSCYRDLTTDCTLCHDNVIINDLAPFQDAGGISKAMMEAASQIKRITKYQIINHKLYRSENCMFPFRCKGIEYFLKSLLSELPDTEFYLNCRDWPMASRYLSKEPIPVFSFSKTSEYWDIMYPAWTFWEGGPALDIFPTGLGRWDKYITSLTTQANKYPWSKKLDKGFFRGSRTSAERDPLILLSRQNPDIIDAQFTKNQAWRSDKDTLGAQPADEVTLEHHCRYKYLFNYRGVAASFRLKHLFLCGSLVIHVGDEWKEFFYPGLKPWYHYIPLSASATQQQILQTLEFVWENKDTAGKIADRGFNFISEHLKFKDIGCYWRKLLVAYTELLKYPITRDYTLFEI